MTLQIDSLGRLRTSRYLLHVRAYTDAGVHIELHDYQGITFILAVRSIKRLLYEFVPRSALSTS